MMPNEKRMNEAGWIDTEKEFDPGRLHRRETVLLTLKPIDTRNVSGYNKNAIQNVLGGTIPAAAA